MIELHLSSPETMAKPMLAIPFPLAKRIHKEESVRLARAKVIHITDMIGGIASAAIKWTALLGIAYEFKECVVALAGHQTFVSLFSSVAANVTVNQWVAYIIAGTGGGYGYAQRRLRKRKVTELSNRIKVLEKVIDPKRSSSGLDPSGSTPKDY